MTDTMGGDAPAEAPAGDPTPDVEPASDPALADPDDGDDLGTDDGDDGDQGEAAPVDAEAQEDPDDKPLTAGQAKALKAEAARHRQDAKRYDEAFDGMPDEHREAFLGAAQLLASDPEQWAAEMQQVIDQIKGGAEQDGGEGDLDPDAPMTPRQLEQYLTQRDAKSAAERQREDRDREVREAIDKDMTDLGYNPKAEKGTPDHRRVVLLRAIAVNETGGDLDAAHKLLEEDRRGAVKAVSEAKKAQRAGSPPVTNGQAGSKTEKGPPMYVDGSSSVNPAWTRWADSR